MASRKDTKIHIVRSALEVLKTLGAEGMTLRKVAAHADISLGNLQYHYKDKSALLAGLAHIYFGECVTLMDAYEHQPTATSTRARMHDLILFFLDHVDHLSDMCRLFRELWALAARDDGIQAELTTYYQAMAEKLAAILKPMCPDQTAVDKVVGLLQPYFEGYSITVTASQLTKQETADMLTDVCVGIVNSQAL